mmetsp:Transcript_15527/g.22905  ORF Transcript_15527/g.22905 Transcript_15527/m.22905 type:complete len:191 (-) Transcript_15527:284-856(-)
MRGRSPSLAIYIDGKSKERIDLSTFSSIDELHQLMVDKGFVKMSEDKIAQMKKVNFAKQRSEILKRQREKKKRRERRKLMMNKDKQLTNLVTRNALGADSQNISESKIKSLEQQTIHSEYFYGDKDQAIVKKGDQKNVESNILFDSRKGNIKQPNFLSKSIEWRERIVKVMNKVLVFLREKRNRSTAGPS